MIENLNDTIQLQNSSLDFSNSDLIEQDLVETVLSTELKKIFYRCEFFECIKLIELHLKSLKDLDLIFQLLLLKSKCLYELNRVAESKEILVRQSASATETSNPDLIFAKASLAYMDGQFLEAKELFKLLLEISFDKIHRSKALLGLANIAYSKSEIHDGLSYLRELKKIIEDIDQIDIHLSFKLTEAHFYLLGKMNVTYAKELYQEVYQLAYRNNLKYFTQRSLYYLAKWNISQGQIHSAKTLLSILNLEVTTTDSRFLGYLINEEFVKINHRSQFKLTLDSESYSVLLGQDGEQVVSLDKWPKLFLFLKLLHEKRDFVSKNAIAAFLWNDQTYLPKTHDPRIYDIVNRLKKILSKLDEKLIFIESSVKGYKLTMTE